LLNKIKKIKNKKFLGKNIFLKKIHTHHCNKKYLSWLNDKKINQYLEAKWTKYNIRSLKKFVNSCNLNESIILFGIFYKNEHVGNIKIDINMNHSFCYLGYFIGERRHQGKKLAFEAINICCHIVFKLLNLRMCFAGVYSINKPGIKVLEKNKFNRISTIKNLYKIKNKFYTDELTYSLKNIDFKYIKI
jgi:[ribosomal protein S5]-alanine N-acetyltransferase